MSSTLGPMGGGYTPQMAESQIHQNNQAVQAGVSASSGMINSVSAMGPNATPMTSFDSMWNYDLYNEKAEYNTKEAEKARAWQEYMSNTAYQRAVADMKKAGINPALLYQNGGQGASSSAGAVASAPSGGYNSVSGKTGTNYIVDIFKTLVDSITDAYSASVSAASRASK